MRLIVIVLCIFIDIGSSSAGKDGSKDNGREGLHCYEVVGMILYSINILIVVLIAKYFLETFSCSSPITYYFFFVTMRK